MQRAIIGCIWLRARTFEILDAIYFQMREVYRQITVPSLNCAAKFLPQIGANRTGKQQVSGSGKCFSPPSMSQWTIWYVRDWRQFCNPIFERSSSHVGLGFDRTQNQLGRRKQPICEGGKDAQRKVKKGRTKHHKSVYDYNCLVSEHWRV